MGKHPVCSEIGGGERTARLMPELNDLLSPTELHVYLQGLANELAIQQQIWPSIHFCCVLRKEESDPAISRKTTNNCLFAVTKHEPSKKYISLGYDVDSSQFLILRDLSDEISGDSTNRGFFPIIM